jgi:hypothetical protein
MGKVTRLWTGLVERVAPEIAAQATCDENDAWYEHREICVGHKTGQKQQRKCMSCGADRRTVCGDWHNVGGTYYDPYC